MFESFWAMFETQDYDIKPVASEDAFSFPECDYDTDCTALYKQIQIKNWVAVNQFLLTGYWTGALWVDPSPPREQACTWVTKYDRSTPGKKKVAWTHLPLHASLMYGAPEGVIQLLCKISPPSVRCADDRRMLPLHIAFEYGCPDTTIATIMDGFPEAVAVRDFRGRSPASCGDYSQAVKRGHIIQTILQYNEKAWQKKAAKAQDKQLESIRSALNARNERLSQLEDAMELVLCREGQTQDSFKLIVAEIKKMKEWYSQKEAEIGEDSDKLLDTRFVRQLSRQVADLDRYAKDLTAQQKQSKAETDKTLEQLQAVWQSKEVTDVKIRNFDAEKKQEDNHTRTSHSSGTSLDTKSTAKKDSISKRSPSKTRGKSTKGQAEDNSTLPSKTEYSSRPEKPIVKPLPKVNKSTKAKSSKGTIVKEAEVESKQEDRDELAEMVAEVAEEERSVFTSPSLSSGLDEEPEVVARPTKKDRIEEIRAMQSKMSKQEKERKKIKEIRSMQSKISKLDKEKEQTKKPVKSNEAKKAASTSSSKEDEVPTVVSLEKTGTLEDRADTIEHAISEMTSLDMSENVSIASSRIRAFKKRVGRITKLTSRTDKAQQDPELETKDSTKRGLKKAYSRSSRSKASAQVTPVAL